MSLHRVLSAPGANVETGFSLTDAITEILDHRAMQIYRPMI
jgi:hypothetical protein